MNPPDDSKVHLGIAKQYADNYDPELLQGISRAESRKKIDLPDHFGEDIWTAYELSWLTPSGKPQVALAEFAFPCDSPQIVESKSFKYYLNSFNQTTFADTEALVNVMKKDLKKVCGSDVNICLRDLDHHVGGNSGLFAQTKVVKLDQIDTNCSVYSPDIGLLEYEQEFVDAVFVSHLLKTNCPVTAQPDWASLWIGVKGQAVSPESLLRYIVSFRRHQDFHEHCVERIFSDIYRVSQLDQLWVYARYTRRGGLDINPLRSLKSMPRPDIVGPRQ